MKILYEYKEARFSLQEVYSYKDRKEYLITSVDKSSETLFLPSEANGHDVIGFAFPSLSYYGDREKYDHSYPFVKKIVIPSKYRRMDSLNNLVFPCLEEIRIEAGNSEYWTDGKMLYKKGGEILCLSMGEGMREGTVIIPDSVKKIGSDAFQYSVCKEVVFENPDVVVDYHAFDHSVWLDKSMESGGVYIGNTLYRAPSSGSFTLRHDTLKIDGKAFGSAKPNEITTHIMPSSLSMGVSRYSLDNGCRILNYTSGKKINFDSLRKWNSLAAVNITNEKNYKTIDGVIFSREGDVLLFYPNKRTTREYSIPNGVTTIGRLAFSDQKYLEKVIIPDTVTVIRQGAFFGCSNLKKVRLPKKLKELQDASIFQPFGVFQGCSELESIALPASLKHIGAWAFMDAGLLSDIEIAEGIESIGEYAFCNTSLDEIMLPASIRNVGIGAFLNENRHDRVRIRAYEGTARGLICALEAVPRDALFKTANIVWQGVIIEMINMRKGTVSKVEIPESLKHSSGETLDAAWNQEEFDFTLYDEVFENISDTTEKMRFALSAIEREEDMSDSPYPAYIRKVGNRIAEMIIKNYSEEYLVGFLKKGYLTEASLKTVLKQCNKNGYDTGSAYILSQIDILRKKKKNTAVRL